MIKPKKRQKLVVPTEDDLIVESFFVEPPSDNGVDLDEPFENDNIEIDESFDIDDVLEINVDIEE